MCNGQAVAIRVIEQSLEKAVPCTAGLARRRIRGAGLCVLHGNIVGFVSRVLLASWKSSLREGFLQALELKTIHQRQMEAQLGSTDCSFHCLTFDSRLPVDVWHTVVHIRKLSLHPARVRQGI